MLLGSDGIGGTRTTPGSMELGNELRASSSYKLRGSVFLAGRPGTQSKSLTKCFKQHCLAILMRERQLVYVELSNLLSLFADFGFVSS